MTLSQHESRYSPDARDIYLTVPNVISLLRIVSIPFISYFAARQKIIEALVILAFSALSDGIDGFIARKFNQVSKIGQILDPIADRLLILCSILALGLAHIIPWWMLIIVGLRDLTLLILILVLAQHDYGPLPVNFVGKTGTALLMISIAALLFADLWKTQLLVILHLAGLAAGIWGIILYWLAGYTYIRQGVTLIANDRRNA